jgi:hypothetical protein
MNSIFKQLRVCLNWRDTHIDTITGAQDKGDTDAAEIIRISHESSLTLPIAIKLIVSVERFREKVEVRK